MRDLKEEIFTYANKYQSKLIIVSYKDFSDLLCEQKVLRFHSYQGITFYTQYGTVEIVPNIYAKEGQFYPCDSLLEYEKRVHDKKFSNKMDNLINE